MSKKHLENAGSPLARARTGREIFLGEGTVKVGNFMLTPVGLQVAAGSTFDEWQAFHELLDYVKRAYQWMVADWSRYGADRWGQKYDEIAAKTGYDVNTLRDMAYVARQVDLSVRTDKLTFTHHKLVAHMERGDQVHYLALAAENNWPVKRLRAEIEGREIERVGRIERLVSDADRWLNVAKNAPEYERRQMADVLRQTADRIEELG